MFRTRTHTAAHRTGPAAGTRVWPRAPHVSTLAVLVAGVFTIIAVLTWSPRQVSAAELRQGDTVIVPPGETIDDDLYAFGQTVTIQGTVNGDVVAAGQSVNLGGNVTGNVMAAGSTVIVSSPIAGTARLAGQTIEISAPIGRDLLAGGATLNVGPRAGIGRDVLVAGNAVTLSGSVGRSIRASAESLTLGGPVDGDIAAQAGVLTLADGAAIGGNLTYTSSREALIAPGATVGGAVARQEAPAVPSEPGPAAQAAARILSWLKALIGISALGLLLVLVFPTFSRRTADTLGRSPWASLGLGFALLAGIPVAAVLLFVVGLLIGGWWLGPLVLALYVGALPAAYALGGLFVGQAVTTRARRPDLAIWWVLLIGLVLLGLVSAIPAVGGLVVLLTLLFGLGALAQTLAATYRGHGAPVGRAGPPTPEAAGPLAAPSNGAGTSVEELSTVG